MGGGKHPRWPENVSFQVDRHTASLPWEDCWDMGESLENGDNGPFTGFKSVEAKALPVLEEQTIPEDSSIISEEHSDEASIRQTVMVGKTDSDASLAKPSVGNSVTTEPEAFQLGWDLPSFSEPGELPELSPLPSEGSSQESPNSGKFEGPITRPPFVTEKEKWRADMRNKILRQRELRKTNLENIQDVRDRVLSYRPGAWLIEAGGVKRKGYDIPDVTTLLLVGPMGAGKSTLINNMIRVVNNKTSKFDRAQVCGDLTENGTFFLHEHMLCDGSESICVYDSRGLSEVDTADALATLRSWVEKGIRHGQVVVRSSDSNATRCGLESKARHGHSKISKKRNINFVIYVVNAVSLDSMRRSADWASRSNLIKLIKSPFLSFRDDRPVVVMTHGDKLSLDDRIQAQIFLSEMIGLSPADHVFDISGFTGRVVNEGDIDPCDDMALLDMLEYALERADRNLPYKQPTPLNKVSAYTGVLAVQGKEVLVNCCGMIWQTISGALNSPNPNCVEIVIVVLTAAWTLAFLLLLLVLSVKWILRLMVLGRMM